MGFPATLSQFVGKTSGFPVISSQVEAPPTPTTAAAAEFAEIYSVDTLERSVFFFFN